MESFFQWDKPDCPLCGWFHFSHLYASISSSSLTSLSGCSISTVHATSGLAQDVTPIVVTWLRFSRSPLASLSCDYLLFYNIFQYLDFYSSVFAWQILHIFAFCFLTWIISFLREENILLSFSFLFSLYFYSQSTTANGSSQWKKVVDSLRADTHRVLWTAQLDHEVRAVVLPAASLTSITVVIGRLHGPGISNEIQTLLPI